MADMHGLSWDAIRSLAHESARETDKHTAAIVRDLGERIDRLAQQIAVVSYMVEQVRDELWDDPGGVDRRANERVEKLLKRRDSAGPCDVCHGTGVGHTDDGSAFPCPCGVNDID